MPYLDRYICPITLDYTNTASGSIYLSLYNGHTRNICVESINYQTAAETGSGNTKSLFGFCRYQGDAITGGSGIPIAKLDSSLPTIGVQARKDNAGITATGSIVATLFEVVVKTGDASIFASYKFEHGLILAPTEGIVIRAIGDVLLNNSMHGCIEFSSIK